MTSRKKLNLMRTPDPLDQTDAEDSVVIPKAAGEPSLQQIDSAVYGTIKDAELRKALNTMDSHRLNAGPINIFEIKPYALQPRRAIPHILRQEWSGDVNRIGELFDLWVQKIHTERQTREDHTPFDILAYLDEKVLPPEFEERQDFEADDKSELLLVGPMEEALLRLISLAVSIRRDGLANPITVVSHRINLYEIETGERRWLAFHVLYHFTKEERFRHISARTVPGMNLWRQAAENNARDNLNAISKARQLALLLMDLLEHEADFHFKPFDQFVSEHSFYAQVADGEEHRIPRGAADKLLNATGFKNKRQLRDYRALLRLPGIVWQTADDLNWAERTIRDMVSRAGKDEDYLLQLVVDEARKRGYSVPMGTLSKKRPTKSIAAKETATIERAAIPAPGSPKYYNRLSTLLKKAEPGKTAKHKKP